MTDRRRAGWPASRGRRSARLLATLEPLERVLASIRKRWSRAEDPTALGPDESAVEWFLDNSFVIEQALEQVRASLPPGFYRELALAEDATPRAEGRPPDGTTSRPSASPPLPRVHRLAVDLLAVEEYHLAMDSLVDLLDTHQERSPLTLGEVWALPAMLRLALLQAVAWSAGSLAGMSDHPDWAQALDGFAPPGEGVPDREASGLDPGDLVARAVASLRVLEEFSWEATAERVSVVHRTLAEGDPDGVYLRMDYASRDRYRRAVEAVARRSPRSELEVARAAVGLAGSGPGAVGDRRRHVGYFLVDEGLAELEGLVGARPGPGGWRRWACAHPTGSYLATIWVITAVIVGGAAWYAATSTPPPTVPAAPPPVLRWPSQPWPAALAALLMVVPALTAAVALVNWVISQVLPPRVLAKLDLADGIPAEHATLVVVPALVTRATDVDDLLRQLRDHHARNPDPALTFAVLSDFADAPTESGPGDAELLAHAEQALARLNEATPGAPFLFLHRCRRWNPAERVWMGWERKRGKLHELNRLLQGRTDTSYVLIAGDRARLAGVRFVITLDADTLLPPDAAHRLVGTLAHPLNRPVLDPATGRVVAGYSVLQPRAEIDPDSAGASGFTRVFAGDTTVDLYTLAVSDAYQDLFGTGIYVGKGIYDVAAFESAVAGRVPDNTLLSHDLFEGVHGRVGLVSDITVYEDYPPNMLAGLLRTHRWVRGDWQLIRWLAPRTPRLEGSARNDLPLIDRWKIVDNLRRSLIAPATLALLLAAWLGLPGHPAAWTTLAMLTPLVQLAAGLVALGGSWLSARLGRNGGDGAGPRAAALRTAAARWVVSTAGLALEASVAIDAIVRTLWRLVVSRRHLLEWTTAAASARLVGDGVSLASATQSALPSLLTAAAVGAAVAVLHPPGLVWAAPFLVAWLAAPGLVAWLSRPTVPRRPAPLTGAQRRTFGTLARRTWLFFEQHVGPEDNWLPPDNVQVEPLGVVAHRTSPTNIGLYLLSCLAAHDRGYLGTPALVSRLTMAFEALDRVERHRGHLPNWLDTTSLQPLRPAYVSTVDSGNLAACLVILAQGCDQALGRDVRDPVSTRGLVDTLALVAEGLDPIDGDAAVALRRELAQLSDQVDGLDARAAPLDTSALPADTHHRWATLLADLAEGAGGVDVDTLDALRLHSGLIERHLLDVRRDEQSFLPWVPALRRPPRPLGPRAAGLLAAAAAPTTWQQLPDRCAGIAGLLRQLADTADDPRTAVWASDLADAVTAAGARARELCSGLRRLAERARQEVAGLELGFLYDRARGVFHIGYNLDTGALDGSYYDLLASEARVTGLVAIARHQVPQEHWLHLGRPMTHTLTGDRALLSWSGTMFEYLLPTLLVETPPDSQLGRTCAAAVAHQVAFGRARGIPWGISESGFHAFDAHLNYQYRAFGVPGLALERRSGDDLVVAPYASLMATPFDPTAVAENLARLAGMGAIGRLGAYEAIDFTRPRVPLGREFAIVRSHMAHHQGMVLLGLAQALDGPSMIERFHAEPFTASVSLLLREEPGGAPDEPQAMLADEPPAPLQPPHPVGPWPSSGDDLEPGVHWLSNGHLHVLVTDSGAGATSRGPVALTRGRADASLEEWGTWLYLQDLKSGGRWSAARRPAGEGIAERAMFHPARAEFRAWYDGIRSDLQVTVAPDADVEVRRIEVTNETDRPRTIAVTHFAEVVLTDQATDLRHPAFGKLFVEAEPLPGDLAGLLFRRRPRSDADPATVVAFSLVRGPSEVFGEAPTWGQFRRSADRRSFLGRLRTASDPRALDADGWWTALAADVGPAPLDPAVALGQTFVLPAHGRARLALVTCAADNTAAALDLVHHHQSWAHLEHTFATAALRADHELRDLGFRGQDLAHAQRLLSLLLYPHPALAGHPDADVPAPALPPLWGLGISGDLPLVCAHLADDDDLPLAEDLLRAHRYWRRRGLQVDIALVDEQASGYAEGLRRALERLVTRWDADLVLNVPGGVFLLSRDQLGGPVVAALHRAAQVVLDAGGGGLGARLGRLPERPVPLPVFDPGSDPDQPPAGSGPPAGAAAGASGAFDNGLGAFVADGREYEIRTSAGRATPAPWANVAATPVAGFLSTESGLGATWVANSGENRLTPWRNDPLTDLPAEVVYVRDEETGQVWTPTPRPAGAAVEYVTRHGAGYTEYEHTAHGLHQRLVAFVVADAPAKALHLRVHNPGGRPRRLTVTGYAEWVLGVHREGTAHRLGTSFDADTGTMLAGNPFHPDRPRAVAFLAADRPVHGWTADRLEFLGRPGHLARPAGLVRIGLARTAGVGHDPCAALQVHLDVAADAEEEVTFLLGQADGREEALAMVRRLREAGVGRLRRAADDFWADLLGGIEVRTPDPALDLMVNRWLPYQTLAGRLWGRTGFYQSSGAYGFRDQLQDALALVGNRPDLVREQLLRAAAHQFGLGDVLHWWHEPARGVRTRISDDLLWLPYATARYVEATGDADVLTERVPFLAGAPLAPDQHEHYDSWATSDETATLLEHCRRAVERGATTGRHRMPLIGTGDWNDGFNRVGDAGRGESVWLAWFAHRVLLDMARLSELGGHDAAAATDRSRAAAYLAAVERDAWDGAWYVRAYDDGGGLLGSSRNAECRIDSIAQSWAVLSAAPVTDRTRRAVRSAVEQLVRWDERLVLLFTPPLDRTDTDPGYIRGYLPGVRENGGQYTHAATWLAWATAELGDPSTAAALLDLLNPVRRTATADGVERYAGEPYVLAGDVYAGAHPGRAGWTWYTGSSAWFQRTAVEGILGLRWRGDALTVEPCLPADWPGYTAVVRRGRTALRVTVRRRPGGDVEVDQEPVHG